MGECDATDRTSLGVDVACSDQVDGDALMTVSDLQGMLTVKFHQPQLCGAAGKLVLFCIRQHLHVTARRWHENCTSWSWTIDRPGSFPWDPGGLILQ